MGRHFFVTGDDFILRPVLEAISRAGSIAAVYFGVSFLIWKLFCYLFFDHFLNLDIFLSEFQTQKIASSTVLESRELSGTKVLNWWETDGTNGTDGKPMEPMALI